MLLVKFLSLDFNIPRGKTQVCIQTYTAILPYVEDVKMSYPDSKILNLNKR